MLTPSQPSVSVIIPNLNYGRWLGQAIESALQQTIPPAEVIIVDGGSVDHSASVARRYPVRWIEQLRRGHGTARNTGIAKTSSDWIIGLDSDDWIESTYIERCLSEVHPSTGIVATALQWEGGSIGVQGVDEPVTIDRLFYANRLFCASMFRRSAWMEIGGYSELPIYEDWDLWMRILAAGYGIAVIQEPLFHYRSHDQQSSVAANPRSDSIKHSMQAAWKSTYQNNLLLHV